MFIENGIAGFYGTIEETYYLNDRGELYCVQSPDLAATNGEPTRVFDLPKDALPLSSELCADIEVPEAIA